MIPRQYKLCISSTSGGGGKTLFSLGLGALLREKGYKVKPFKKGPDFIDSAWLSAACGIPAANLDPFFLEKKELITFFRESFRQSGASFALLEGNRGLYDGLDAAGSYSTATLSRILDFPILLTLNCAKSTRTIAAIVNGLTSFEPGLRFAGIVFNNVGSARHEKALIQALSSSTDLPVLGSLPRLPENPLPERHMGLATTGSQLSPHARQIFSRLANLIRENCDLDKILLASEASLTPNDITDYSQINKTAHKENPETVPLIGYSQDSAFWFYYPENLQALEKAGAKLQAVSLLDPAVFNWKNLSGLYLGGGFPEDYCEELSSSPHLAQIRQLAALGCPIYAECGGLLLLCKSLAFNGGVWQMAGLFDLHATWHPRPKGLGYVEGKVTGKNPYFPLGLSIKGHEFHYSSCAPSEDVEYKIKLSRGTGLAEGHDGVCIDNVWGSYLHIFAPAMPIWAKNFVKLASDYQKSSLLHPTQWTSL